MRLEDIVIIASDWGQIDVFGRKRIDLGTARDLMLEYRH